MKAIVFGGSGFLGSHVADELSNNNFEVIIADIKESLYISKKQIFKYVDILDLNSVIQAVAGCDIVYNFAGLADINIAISEPLKTVKLNILGNTNILEACRLSNIKRYIYASSAYVFSQKGSFYGISKQASEKMIEEYNEQFNLEYTIIRYGSVYGPRADKQNRIYCLIKEALESNTITYKGTGNEVREYIHVKDAAKLSVEILNESYKNEHIILTGIEKHTYKELLNIIKEIINDDIVITYSNENYKGHYEFSPYSLYHPKVGKKIVNNPYIDFGQGLLEIMIDIQNKG
ncbi:UDP-glucose 4-epimerase [Malaciobacter mytili LMG 24559]|uniref:UDP-glucose 4-epimerase n=1 Tax=Malaciobacter mytili LMG 24559 TaxID=1032238 RepID=A0AAX2AHB3_9BACT|nr:NAD(P)-dependent oxidoreductase [Malaciobacter mytili]AXH15816.1 UDP-N-acetylglucosamine 4-epimerase [Malaciobacter mytili LMG 24559]RXK16382.1 UDP-glucose 4-epimerase [Malaciobacter mytili LMG 24559]